MNDSESVTEAAATRQVLNRYRIARQYGGKRPWDAAAAAAESAALILANQAIAYGMTEDAREQYRVALAVEQAVHKRSAVLDGRKFNELSRTEQFWSTGHLTDKASIA